MSERFISPCALPEGLTRELLVILMEECSEVAIRASKALRFGLEEVQPGQPENNAERLGVEIGDLKAVVERLHMIGALNAQGVHVAMLAKRGKLARFLQSEPDA